MTQDATRPIGAAKRIVMDCEPVDGSWTIEVQLDNGQTLLTAGDDPLDALNNAIESWPEELERDCGD